MMETAWKESSWVHIVASPANKPNRLQAAVYGLCSLVSAAVVDYMPVPEGLCPRQGSAAPFLGVGRQVSQRHTLCLKNGTSL